VAAVAVPTVFADTTGSLTLLPETAELHGEGIKTEEQGGQPNIGFWDSARDWASWKASIRNADRYKVMVSTATVHQGAVLVVDVAGRKLEAKPPCTGAFDKFAEYEVGTVELRPGDLVIAARPHDEASWKAINLRWIKLVR